MIEVADTGPGVPRRARKALFRVQLGTRRRNRLGLVIASDLVRAHGGSLTLASTSAVGANAAEEYPALVSHHPA
ncbi:protein of unknown function [Methylocella tundrae]|uniref:Histidine kinase domain-containing protein n=1 Tax=Methylocella tundrae TaxID=227605 RepID=A0A4V6IMZ6_METTU|nr:ATP-binding protein [Methylocella tundrae]VFU09531.1 protein of unknown function [Methylocella tundrae]